MMAWMVADDMRAKQLLRKQTKLDGAGLKKTNDKYRGRQQRTRRLLGQSDKRDLDDTLRYLNTRITDGASWRSKAPKVRTLDIAGIDLINAFGGEVQRVGAVRTVIQEGPRFGLSPSAVEGLVLGELVRIADPFALITRTGGDEYFRLLIGKIIWPLDRVLYRRIMVVEQGRAKTRGSDASLMDQDAVPVPVSVLDAEAKAAATRTALALMAGSDDEPQGGAGAAEGAASTLTRQLRNAELGKLSRGARRGGRSKAGTQGRRKTRRTGGRGARGGRGGRLFADVEELYLCGKVNALRF
jgi:hypothetical protein